MLRERILPKGHRDNTNLISAAIRKEVSNEIKTHHYNPFFVMAFICAGCGGGGASGNGSNEPGDETAAMKVAKLLIEHNATDEDTGFQGFVDGDPWNELVISAPGGDQILTVFTEGGLLDFGLTELFFETSEPPNAEVPIDRVLSRLSEGEYAFTGEMVEADDSSATTPFTHRIPAGPNLLTPADGSTGVDPNNVIVAWDAVSEDLNGADINIVGYQVIVEKDEEPKYPQGFARALFSIHLPATATSVTVSREFMESGAPYKYEVLAIAESGNQTLSLAAFETK